ncbi:hypothetical protein ACQEVB_24675 [Pseudonocardia sp. CA-107938]|uniref:hypothetical protein n=1 Tax=Pseudonocardia sp. CA-107938 TaxID=3240021 RepID=UPI003D8F3FB8
MTASDESLLRLAAEGYERPGGAAAGVLLHPTFRYEELRSGVVLDASAFLARWKEVREVFPDVRAEVRRVAANVDVTAADVVWRATCSPLASARDADKILVVPDVVITRWRGRRQVAELHEVGVLSIFTAAAREVTNSLTGT